MAAVSVMRIALRTRSDSLGPRDSTTTTMPSSPPCSQDGFARVCLKGVARRLVERRGKNGAFRWVSLGRPRPCGVESMRADGAELERQPLAGNLARVDLREPEGLHASRAELREQVLQTS